MRKDSSVVNRIIVNPKTMHLGNANDQTNGTPINTLKEQLNQNSPLMNVASTYIFSYRLTPSSEIHAEKIYDFPLKSLFQSIVNPFIITGDTSITKITGTYDINLQYKYTFPGQIEANEDKNMSTSGIGYATIIPVCTPMTPASYLVYRNNNNTSEVISVSGDNDLIEKICISASNFAQVTNPVDALTQLSVTFEIY